mgnify:CR=1 FL=1
MINQDNKKMSDEVIMFLSEFSSVNVDAISLDSDIVRDIHIEGDDAEELLQKFSERFGVDISALNLSDYFAPESSFSPIDYLLSIILSRKIQRKSLFVKDLVNAAKVKKWKVNENKNAPSNS